MLVAAAVCPCPPLLVPAVAAGAASELDAARAACADALAVLAAARPDRLVVVGATAREGAGAYPPGAAGSFQDFGVDVTVRLGRPPAGGTADGPAAAAGDQERELPASLAVAGWLLESVRWQAAPVHGYGVTELLTAERCIRLGRELAEHPGRSALLVMGDASACRTVKAPGYFDERAAGFDDGVGRALERADVTALQALDVEPAHELKAAGRAPWQVLAGAAEGAGMAGRLLYEDAPYGVGYLVAAWS